MGNPEGIWQAVVGLFPVAIYHNRVTSSSDHWPIVRSIIPSDDRSYDKSWSRVTDRTIKCAVRRVIIRSIVASSYQSHDQSIIEDTLSDGHNSCVQKYGMSRSLLGGSTGGNPMAPVSGDTLRTEDLKMTLSLLLPMFTHRLWSIMEKKPCSCRTRYQICWGLLSRCVCRPAPHTHDGSSIAAQSR